MYLRFFSTFRVRCIQIPNSPLSLREPARRDQQQWVELRRVSAEFLQKWEPKWPDDDLSPAGFQRRLRSYVRQRQAGTSQTYFLFDDANNLLLGGLCLTRIKKRPERSAVLGYWMGEPHTGKGYMSEAVTAALDQVFNQINLDEVQAACLPHNKPSIALLEKSGFQRCGYSQKHLEINGILEDHLLFSRSREHIVGSLSGAVENAGKSGIPMV